MSMLAWPGRFLGFLGRYGSQAFALSLLLGFALPWLAGPVKPFLGVIIFCFIAINMMRADLPALRRLATRPALMAGAVVWCTVAPAMVVGALVAIVGRSAFEPGLLLGLAIAAAAPPLVAAPAYALVLGFSNAMALTLLVLGMAVTPLTAPFIADLIAGTSVPIDRMALTVRLAIFLFGAMAAGLAARKLIGARWMIDHKPELDGVGVVLFFIFAVALTESISDAVLATPARAAYYMALVFGISIVIFVLSVLVWRRIEPAEATPIALATGLRNTGLLIAVMGVNDVPAETFLFFALLQFPIYFAPQLVKPFLGLMAGKVRQPSLNS